MKTSRIFDADWRFNALGHPLGIALKIPRRKLLLICPSRNSQLNSDPVIRGRKLLLNYTDGSPCPSHPYTVTSQHKRTILPSPRNSKTVSDSHFEYLANTASPLDHSVESLAVPIGGGSNTRRKNTVISLLCEDEPTAPKVSLAFLASPDECSYFFELRSPFACPAVNVAKQQVGPSGVFGLM